MKNNRNTRLISQCVGLVLKNQKRPSSGRSPALRRARRNNALIKYNNGLRNRWAGCCGKSVVLLTLMCKSILTLYCFIKKVREMLPRSEYYMVFRTTHLESKTLSLKSIFKNSFHICLSVISSACICKSLAYIERKLKTGITIL